MRGHQPHFAVLQDPVAGVVEHKEQGRVLGEIGLLQMGSQLVLGGRLWVADNLRVTAGR